MRCALLVLDDPWATSHGGTQRTRSFMRALTALGHDVVCVYCTSERGVRPVSDEGVDRVPVFAPPLGERDLPKLVKRLKRSLLPLPTVAAARSGALTRALQEVGHCDVLLVQQLRTAQYADAMPGAALWFDQVDLWSSFAASEMSVRSGLPKLTTGLQRRSFVKQEWQFAKAARIVTAAGYGDAEILGRAAGRDVRWLPNPSFVARSTPATKSALPRVAGLLGNFHYWPNRMGYDVLVRSWAQRLREQGWRVVVAGHGSDELPASENIEILGPLEDPQRFYSEIGLALAPIVTGGGIKVKVLEALFAGVPVAATPAALEGFPPAVRALVHTVGDDGAELWTLDRYLADRSTDGSALDVFDPDAFRLTVSRCLEAVR